MNRHIERQKTDLEKNNELIEAKKQTISRLEQQMSQYVHRCHIRQRYQIIDQIKQLQTEIKEISQRQTLPVYQGQVLPYLQAEGRDLDIRVMRLYSDIRQDTVVQEHSSFEEITPCHQTVIYNDVESSRESNVIGGSQSVLTDYLTNVEKQTHHQIH